MTSKRSVELNSSTICEYYPVNLLGEHGYVIYYEAANDGLMHVTPDIVRGFYDARYLVKKIAWRVEAARLPTNSSAAPFEHTSRNTYLYSHAIEIEVFRPRTPFILGAMFMYNEHTNEYDLYVPQRVAGID